jgi:hypothetical protein
VFRKDWQNKCWEVAGTKHEQEAEKIRIHSPLGQSRRAENIFRLWTARQASSHARNRLDQGPPSASLSFDTRPMITGQEDVSSRRVCSPRPQSTYRFAATRQYAYEESAEH